LVFRAPDSALHGRTTRMAGYFSWLREGVLIENKDTRMAAFPETILGAALASR